MVTFCILVAPLPFTVRKRLFSFLSTSAIVAKVAYALKISFMCDTTILGVHSPGSHLCQFQICRHFVRRCTPTHVPYYCRNRISKVWKRWIARYKGRDEHACSEVLVRFQTPLELLGPYPPYSSQRNVYLTGFCLFLSLVLTRTFKIILELINTQEEYAKIKQQVNMMDSPQ